MSNKPLILFISRLLTYCSVALGMMQTHATELFEKPNLVAWCIVPFDASKRSPEARAAMVASLGLNKIAYDWRQEHVVEFEREILAYQNNRIEMFAFWGVHDEAMRLFEKHRIHPQLWVMLNAKGESQEERIRSASANILPVLQRADKIGCVVGIYNHGGWGGEPENMVAVCQSLIRDHNAKNVGIVYNLHHAHDHLDRLSAAMTAMLPHLLCVNLNGTDVNGEANGRKILPLGVGTEDLKVLRIIRDSGYRGPIGILNHTDADAEARLRDNLDGLKWLTTQLDSNPPAAKPQYRTWKDNRFEPGSQSRNKKTD